MVSAWGADITGNAPDAYSLEAVVELEVPRRIGAYSDRYWTGTEYAPNPDFAWDFHFDDGLQDTEYKFIDYYALAVHSGDVGAPVPIPGAIFLFAPGLAGIAALKRRTGRRG